MLPGTTTTGPGEGRENLDGVQAYQSEKTVQVGEMTKFCDQLCNKDPDFQEKVKKYHKRTLSREGLKEEFTKRLRNTSKSQKIRLGIEEGASLEDFLSETQCFENQLLYEIEHASKLRNKAREELATGCVESAAEEYDMTAAQKQKLTEKLLEEEIHTLNVFLESPKFRKKLIGRHLPNGLTAKTLDDINFTTLHNEIANLPPTDPQTRYIQDVWIRMLGGFGIGANETPEQAFQRIQTDGSEGKNLTANFEAFFNCPDTLISPTNKKRILSFLMRQYVPLISLQALQSVDPLAAQELLGPQVPPLDDITVSDTERANALKTERTILERTLYEKGLALTMIPTHKLPMATRIKLLGAYGSKKHIQQKNAFYNGRPSDLGATSRDYEAAFQKMYEFDTDEVCTHDGLKHRLSMERDIKIQNIEKFVPGNVMIRRKKGENGDVMIGYYAIDSVLSEDDDHGSIQMRYMGNNKAPLSAVGLPRAYSGPQFFDYLADSEEGVEIDFIDGNKLSTQAEQDGTRLFTQQEVYTSLAQKYGETEIPDKETLDAKVDEILYKAEDGLESTKAEERKLEEGMTLADWDDSNGFLYAFKIASIDEGNKRITLADGMEGKAGEDDYEMGYLDFVNLLRERKNNGKKVFRVPVGKKFGVEEFNTMMRSQPHNKLKGEKKHEKNSRIMIRDEGGKIVFGEIDKGGSFQEKNIIRVGPKRDIQIEKIEGEVAHIRIGTFTQTKHDSKTGKITDPKFVGSGMRAMPLSWLWGYIQSNSCTLDKPDMEMKYKEGKSEPNISWWNILMHTHKLGVILDGDLWKAPIKAWEEQHHKDHAFAGKITMALAAEKAQRMSGPGGAFLRWVEWPYLMVGDSSSTIQSYLNELVERIDGMASHHRTRLIRKWGKYHFPDPKFMASLFASMQIFGQLYPYDFDDDKNDPRVKDWYWYNNVMHSGGLDHLDPKKYPHHMPPDNEDGWPLDKAGNKRTEMDMLYDVFNQFQHPLLRNLGRRFEKYMNKGHDNLAKEGGPPNLDRRTTMEDKLDWMMGTVLSAKLPEAFGACIETWLDDGYPTEISTMPYAALLFASREQQLPPPTAESLRKDFQERTKIPMFVFAQNRSLGQTFRETGIALAYTMGKDVGDELKSLCEFKQGDHLRLDQSGRLHGGDHSKAWRKRFEAFWKTYGTQLMGKLSGMRDPTINLMINDPKLFQDLMHDMPEGPKKEQYRELYKRSGYIQNYHARLFEQQNSASHSNIRGSAYYKGDHFRFREFFDVGYPTMWIDWDAYIDENITTEFINGDGTKGDGVFNEMRGFLDAIPDLAKKMAASMGFPDNHAYMHKICESIYEKNIASMKRLMNQAKFNSDKRCSFFNVSAMILGMAKIRPLTDPGGGNKELYEDWKNKMEQIDVEAKRIAQEKGYAESIRYRTDWWKRFEIIVSGDENTIGYSLAEVKEGKNRGVKKDPIEAVSEETMEKTEQTLRGRGRSKKSVPRQVNETLLGRENDD